LADTTVERLAALMVAYLAALTAVQSVVNSAVN
jgi:hypothetical protein